MTEQQAIQFLSEVRRPLLTLHKAILDHERAAYEKEFGPVTPAAFLQVLINGSGFRWITPLSTVIANVDALVDDGRLRELDPATLPHDARRHHERCDRHRSLELDGQPRHHHRRWGRQLVEDPREQGRDRAAMQRLGVPRAAAELAREVAGRRSAGPFEGQWRIEEREERRHRHANDPPRGLPA